jgi:hypothetical protein
MIVGKSRPHDGGEGLLVEQGEFVHRRAVQVQAAQPFHCVRAAVQLDRPAMGEYGAELSLDIPHARNVC